MTNIICSERGGRQRLKGVPGSYSFLWQAPQSRWLRASSQGESGRCTCGEATAAAATAAAATAAAAMTARATAAAKVGAATEAEAAEAAHVVHIKKYKTQNINCKAVCMSEVTTCF